RGLARGARRTADLGLVRPGGPLPPARRPRPRGRDLPPSGPPPARRDGLLVPGQARDGDRPGAGRQARPRPPGDRRHDDPPPRPRRLGPEVPVRRAEEEAGGPVSGSTQSRSIQLYPASHQGGEDWYGKAPRKLARVG